MNTAGFYTSKGDYAPNAVYAPNYVLLAENKETYQYPIHGWTWYNSVEEAQAAENFDISVIDAIKFPFTQNINNSEE
jgi:hypothetical protein